MLLWLEIINSKKQWQNVDIVLSSFSYASVNLIRRTGNDIKVSQLFHENNVTLQDIKNFKKDYFEKNIYSVNLYIEDVTPPIVDYCNENNMKIYVYAVNELRAIRYLRELGVDGVFTDYAKEYNKSILIYIYCRGHYRALYQKFIFSRDSI